MRFLALIGALAIVVAIGAAGYFFGGFYDVAATQEDPAVVKWALVQTRTASIARHATATAPRSLGEAGSVEAGARAFLARGCVHCHGAPGVTWSKFSEGLRPGPPGLADVVPRRSPAELFWVIKHGINMTGMPSFAAAGVPDAEIWQIVAFLQKLPGVKEADFKTWTAPPAAAAPAPASPPASASPPAATPTPPPPSSDQ